MDRLRDDDPCNIGLPAEFYKAVEESPMADALAFEATGEQVLAGLHMWRGRVVEMSAGEGKTLAAAFPAVSHAVEGRRVHVVTANDYLALRDAEQLAPVYESLGLSVRAVLQHMNDDERRAAYGADIVYATVRELGFDFLRDNMRHSAHDRVQLGLDVAIVDEADQVLIDESPTPLIISGGRAASRRSVHAANAVVGEMVALHERVVERIACTALELPTGGEKRRALAALFLADPEGENVTRMMTKDPGIASRIRSDAADAIEFDDGSAHLEQLYYRFDPEKASVVPTERGYRFVESRLGDTLNTSELEAARESIRVDSGPDVEGRRRVEQGLDRRILTEARPCQPGPPGHARPSAPAPRRGLRGRRGPGGPGRSAHGAPQAGHDIQEWPPHGPGSQGRTSDQPGAADDGADLHTGFPATILEPGRYDRNGSLVQRRAPSPVRA